VTYLLSDVSNNNVIVLGNFPMIVFEAATWVK